MLMLLDMEKFIYTKVVTIQPRYIFVNQCKERLVVRQLETAQDPLVLEASERKPYFWADDKSPYLPPS